MMWRYTARGSAWATVLLMLVAVVAGCGGNADVSVTFPPPTAPPVGSAAFGQVRLPHGQVASAQPSLLRRFAALALPQAEAISGNVVPVGSGVVVQLVSVAPQDIVGGVIVSSTVLKETLTDGSGNYALVVPDGLSEEDCAGGRLMVQIGNAQDGTLTRAFVFSLTIPVDIYYNSEAVVRLILGKVAAGTPLCNYSANDVQDLLVAVEEAPGTAAGSTVAAINGSAFAIAASSSPIQLLLNEAGANPTPTTTRRPTSTPTQAISPTPSPTTVPPTFTRTNTVGPTFTPTFTKTPTTTNTPTITPTPTGPSPTPTNTPTSTNTNTPSNTPTITPTPTPTTPPPTNTPTVTLTLIPTSTITNTPTVSFTPTNTPTITDTPTLTPTRTSTHTNTPTVTLTPNAVQVDLGSVNGGAGMTVALPATLTTNGSSVSALSNDIEFDPALVDVPLVSGKPDCSIDGRLAGSKQLILGFPSGAPVGKKILRVGVIGDNNTVIAAGALYSCHFAINADTPAGMLTLNNTPGASSPSGDSVTALGSAGHIQVSAAPPAFGLGSVNGTAGNPVSIAGSLQRRGQALAALAMDIQFDPNKLSVMLDGQSNPDCTVDAANKSVFAKLLDSDSMKLLRVGVVSPDNNTQIVDGAAFHCTFVVAEGTSGQTIVLGNTPDAASPDGMQVGVGGGNGMIMVQ
ncbi:MAG: hypothetical protein HYR72_23320 [Deltaproteobacteria bacterium]|nr:hypothetical protein [Deltaproteobacteria bacterium]MBI3389030.1 hypothetical protein [Deltaproteobacteria bacterium]